MRNNKLRMFTLALSLVLIATAFIIGCTPQERPITDRYGTRYYMGNDGTYTGYNTRSPYDYGQGQMQDNRLYGFFDTGDGNRGLGYSNIPENMMAPLRTASNSSNIGRMESACNSINGIQDCTIVRRGDTCYVGCNITKGTNDNVAALRTQCANKIRQIDSSVKKVVLTADNNKVTKLRGMVKDMNMSRPTRSFLNDLENLFK